MDCRPARELLSAHADGELRGLRRWRLTRHLRGCATCAAQLAELQALRARLGAGLPRYAAPAELLERVRAQMQDAAAAPAGFEAGSVRRPSFRASAPAGGAPQRWRWLATGALAGSAATVCALLVGNMILARIAAGEVVAEAVHDHVRAALDGRQIEVASSDRHTVKPWLSARLDYSPPVIDLAQDGFTLAGARLDTLHGQPVAALVYRYGQHSIDVFVRPAPADAPAGPRTLRGFHVAHASDGGMDFLAVSDASPEVLQGLVQRLAAAAPPPGEAPAQ